MPTVLALGFLEVGVWELLGLGVVGFHGGPGMERGLGRIQKVWFHLMAHSLS